MPKAGEVSRAYPIVQDMITKYIKENVPITTRLLQQSFYQENYDADSRTQFNTVYGCIIRGRDQVIKMWDEYLSDKFLSDLAVVQYYEGKKCEDQVQTSDFDDFYDNLQQGRFEKETSIILKNLGDYPAVAVLFERKMREYSDLGNNFLIASYGRGSVWFIPSFWRWNIREFKLYGRTLHILRTQLNRGRTMKVLLPSGTPIPRVLEYETVVRAALQDGTAWACSKCGARNLAQNQNCVICRTPQT